MKNIAIILASGTGSRFNSDIPKQFYKIDNKTVLELSVEAFQNNNGISEIIIVTNPDYIDITKNLSNKYSKVTSVIKGGATRQQSSYNGVFSINENNVNVLIHDAARPFVSQDIITNCIEVLKDYKAVNVAIESSDTVFEVNDKNIMINMPERKNIRRCQTPQCFRIDIIKQAHNLALQDNYKSTDDCGLVLKYNLTDIYVVEGNNKNIKITYKEDLS